MATKIDLIRPDDLLNLRIEATNLRLDSSDPEKPLLVIEDPQRQAFLAFIFPPQTIAERAYFEAAIVNPPVDPNQPKAIKPETDPDRPDPKALLAARTIRLTNASSLRWRTMSVAVPCRLLNRDTFGRCTIS